MTPEFGSFAARMLMACAPRPVGVFDLARAERHGIPLGYLQRQAAQTRKNMPGHFVEVHHLLFCECDPISGKAAEDFLPPDVLEEQRAKLGNIVINRLGVLFLVQNLSPTREHPDEQLFHQTTISVSAKMGRAVAVATIGTADLQRARIDGSIADAQSAVERAPVQRALCVMLETRETCTSTYALDTDRDLGPWQVMNHSCQMEGTVFGHLVDRSNPQ